jgi:hypothetical protein
MLQHICQLALQRCSTAATELHTKCCCKKPPADTNQRGPQLHCSTPAAGQKRRHAQAAPSRQQLLQYPSLLLLLAAVHATRDTVTRCQYTWQQLAATFKLAPDTQQLTNLQDLAFCPQTANFPAS